MSFKIARSATVPTINQEHLSVDDVIESSGERTIHRCDIDVGNEVVCLDRDGVNRLIKELQLWLTYDSDAAYERKKE